VSNEVINHNERKSRRESAFWPTSKFSIVAIKYVGLVSLVLSLASCRRERAGSYLSTAFGRACSAWNIVNEIVSWWNIGDWALESSQQKKGGCWSRPINTISAPLLPRHPDLDPTPSHYKHLPLFQSLDIQYSIQWTIFVYPSRFVVWLKKA
jgi:hypothetical protein